jgi:UDP-galactopyranose mutase
MKNNPVLVVGAGFAGATIARTLADNGLRVMLIDKRSHVGGNAYDYINQHSERIHQYGPHLLHGAKDSQAVKFLSRFTKWIEYEHRVRALLANGSTTPLPVNRTTLEDVYGIKLESTEHTKKFLHSIANNFIEPANCDEMFEASYGSFVSDIFFRPYTRKMWGLDAKDLSIEVGKRLPVRTDRDDRYFTDDFQALPHSGYTRMFENMLDSGLIEVHLNTSFSREMLSGFDHAFLSIPIDEYYGFSLGRLPYRSILFKEIFVRDYRQDAPVVNFTDDGPFTRVTQWAMLPNSGGVPQGSTVTYEQPCDISLNPGEYYYPVRNTASLKVYDEYLKLTKMDSKITFCGRAGLFKYIDMIPAVNIHLQIARKYLEKSI